MRVMRAPQRLNPFAVVIRFDLDRDWLASLDVLVYGPVTLWPQQLVIADCDQISFHTRRAVAGLGNANLEAVAPGTSPLF